MKYKLDLTEHGATILGYAIAAIILAIGLKCATPRYEMIAINNSTNPAIWKLDKFNGDIYLCATASTKDAESGCSAKMKQF